MKLSDIILQEASYFTYTAMVQITTQDTPATEMAELVRALPGVTTVTLTSNDTARHLVVLKIKLISQKMGIEAFQALKQNALGKYSSINVFNVADKSIEKKG